MRSPEYQPTLSILLLNSRLQCIIIATLHQFPVPCSVLFYVLCNVDECDCMDVNRSYLRKSLQSKCDFTN